MLVVNDVSVVVPATIKSLPTNFMLFPKSSKVSPYTFDHSSLPNLSVFITAMSFPNVCVAIVPTSMYPLSSV